MAVIDCSLLGLFDLYLQKAKKTVSRLALSEGKHDRYTLYYLTLPSFDASFTTFCGRYLLELQCRLSPCSSNLVVNQMMYTVRRLTSTFRVRGYG